MPIYDNCFFHFRPLTAYELFFRETQSTIRSKNPAVSTLSILLMITITYQTNFRQVVSLHFQCQIIKKYLNFQLKLKSLIILGLFSFVFAASPEVSSTLILGIPALPDNNVSQILIWAIFVSHDDFEHVCVVSLLCLTPRCMSLGSALGSTWI